MLIQWILCGAVTAMLAVNVAAQSASTAADQKLACYVCTNAPEKGNPLYSKDCLSNPEKLTTVIAAGDPNPTAGVWSCKDYDPLITNALNNYLNSDKASRQAEPVKAGTMEGTGCMPDEFSVCRSFYYKASVDYVYETEKGKEKTEKKLEGSNERVARYCGCIKDKGGSETEEKREKLRKDKLGSSTTKCSDYQQGPLRKRKCLCYNKSDPSKPCNSAHSFSAWVQAITGIMSSSLLLRVMAGLL